MGRRLGGTEEGIVYGVAVARDRATLHSSGSLERRSRIHMFVSVPRRTLYWMRVMRR